MPIVPGEPRNNGQDVFTSTEPVMSAHDGPNEVSDFAAKFDNAEVHLDQSDTLGMQRDSSRIAGEVYDSSSLAPDQAAKILSLEMDTGLPARYIQENMAEVEREKAISGFDIDHYQKRNPKLTKWLAENEGHYALVKDDLDNVNSLHDQIEEYGVLQSAYDAFNSGAAKTISGAAKIPAYAYDVAAIPQNVLANVTGMDSLRTRAPESWYNNPVSKYLDESAQYFADRNSDLNKSIIDQVGSGDYVKAGRTAFAQVMQSAPNTIGLLIGGITGAGVKALAAAGAIQAADTASRPENQAADPAVSALNATASGTLEAAFESVGTFGILKVWERALVKDIGKQGAREVIMNFSKTMLYSVAAEGNEEALTSIAQDLTDYATDINPDALNGIGTRAIDAGIVGAFSGGTLTAAGGIVGARENFRQLRNAAQLQKDFYISLGDTIEASKVRERLPAKFKELSDRMTEEGPVKDIYVDEKAFTEYHQSKPGGVAKAILDLQIEDEYNNAAETGGMIKVPLSRWMDKVGATDAYKSFADHVTFDPNKETVAGSKDLLEASREQAKVASETDLDPHKDARQTIYKEMLTRMEAAKDSGAKKKAEVYAAFMVNTASQLGVDPVQFERDNGFDISRQLSITSGEQVAPGIMKRDVLEAIRAELESVSSDPGGLTTDESGTVTGRFGPVTSAPAYFQGKGYKKADLIKAIDAQIKGKKLTDKQSKMISDVYQNSGYDSDFRTSVEPLLQGAKTNIDDALGRIKLFSSGRSVIEVFQGANLSTSLHEMGHGFFHVLERITTSGQSSERTTKIFTDLLNFTGVDSIEAWSKMDDKARVEYHERLARGFEAYCFEGKAPAPHLTDAFRAFKSWVLMVYRSIRDLDITLTDEARSAFDRLLASDEQIERAKQEQRADPLILDPKAAGLSDAEAEKYSKLVAEARANAEEVLTEKALRQIVRERKKEWKEEQEEIRKRVTPEVDAQADQTLLRLFKQGHLDGQPEVIVKLDRKAAVAELGPERVAALPKELFGKNGLAPSDLASRMGFDSANNMVRMIEGSIPKKELIESLVKEEMEARHGDEDIYKNGKLREEALHAIHNDANSNRLKMEYDFLMRERTRQSKPLTKKIASRVPSVQENRAKARQVIGEMNVREIKPYRFMRAERKHANDAAARYVKGDIEGALESKKLEALNHELYRESMKAQDSLEKYEGKFNKFFQEDKKLALTREMDLINAGRSILAGFGFGTSDKPYDDYLKSIADYNPEGYAHIKERVDQALSNADYYENLSFDRFEALHELVDGLWDLSKLEKTIEIDGKKVLFEDAKNELLAAISKLPEKAKKDKYTRTRTMDDDNIGFFGTLKSRATRLVFKLDTMDEYGGGAFKKYFYNQVRESTEKYREKKGEVFKSLRDLFKTHEDRLGGREIAADSLGHVFRDKNALLGALIHTGNQSNFERLLLGRGWATMDDNGVMDTSAWDSFISECHDNGTLTKADYDLVQGIWDTLEGVKSDTQKAFKDMNGYYFEEIKAKELVTPFGTYRGGYVPATPDNHESIDADIRDTKAKVEGGFMAEIPKKNDGFTKSRVQNYSTPLLMDLGLITTHLDSVLKFTYITPRVKEVMKFAMNRDLVRALKAYDPNFIKHVLEPFLIRATTQTTTLVGNNRGFDRFLSFLRVNQASQLMFLNLPNTFQQVANLVPASLRVKPIHLMSAAKDAIFENKALTLNASERSTFMRNALDRSAENAMAETESMIKNYGKIEKGGQWLSKNAYLSQIHFQNLLSVTVWTASYDQAIAEGNGEVDAVRIADNDVRQTQSSMAAEDAAAVESQTPLVKLLMMFYGFFNNMGNLYTSEWAKAGALDGRAKNVKRAAILGNYVVFALLGRVAIDAMRGKIGDDDDDKESLVFWSKYVFGASFDLTTPMFGIAGQMAQVAKKNAFKETSYGNRVSVAPSIEALDKTLAWITKEKSQTSKDSTEIKGAMTLIGYAPLVSFVPMPRALSGVSPALRASSGYASALGGLKRPVGYLADVNQGKENPNNPLDVAQGLVSGRGKAPK